MEPVLKSVENERVHDEGGPDRPGRPRVAYLVMLYPALSQAFIVREVRALRALGLDVSTYSIKHADRAALLAGADREEAAKTRVLLRPVPAALADHLAALVRGPRVYLALLSTALREGESSLRGKLRYLAVFFLAVRLWRALDRDGVRHVHTHFTGMQTHVAAFAARLGNGGRDKGAWSWSFTVHGPVEFFDVRYYRLSERLRQARFVACISDFARSQAMAFTDREDWSKLHVVHCGVDDAFLAAGNAMSRGGRQEILSVGRLVPFKGQAILISALRRLVERGRDARLTLVGGGPLMDDLQELAAAEGVADRVTFAGPVGQDEMADYYRRADVFCLASFAEGVPVVLMEAMALGVPVVATRVGGIAELIDHGREGFVVPPARPDVLADHLDRLLEDRALRAELAGAARTKVLEEFHVRDAAKRLADLLLES